MFVVISVIKKIIKRLIQKPKQAFALLFTLLLISVPINMLYRAFSANAAVALQQTDAEWCDYPYGDSTVGESGCGALAIVNAVNHLTGTVMDVEALADWGGEHEFVSEAGSKWTIAQDSAAVFGDTYGYACSEYYTFGDITTESGVTNYPDEETFSEVWNKLVSHLKDGETAVALVQGHFIAIVDYDSKKDAVLVLDSAAGKTRDTDAAGSWKTADELNYNSDAGKAKLKLRASLTFLCEKPKETKADAPTWATLSLTEEQDSYPLGTSVNFTMESDNADYYVIGIDYGDERVLTEVLKEGVTTFSYGAETPGAYSAYVSAYKGDAFVNSAIITFFVVDMIGPSLPSDSDHPTWATLSLVDGTTDVSTGETVAFTMTSDNADYYVIGIDQDGERVLTKVLDEGVFTFSYLAETAGAYSAYVSAYKGEAFVNSDVIAFYVSDSSGTKPTWASFAIADGRTAFSIGETVSFAMDSDHGAYYVIGIDRDGKRILTKGLAEGVSTFSYTAETAGAYSAYVSAYRGENFVNSNVEAFYVTDASSTKPAWSTICITDKKTDFDTGETIHFSMDSDHAAYYVIGIDRDGIRVLTKVLEEGVAAFSYEAENAGTYSAYVSAYKGDAFVNSNTVTFAVFGNAPGDILLDGTCTIADAVHLQKYLVQKVRFPESQKKAADVNQDENINVIDSILLKRMLLY